MKNKQLALDILKHVGGSGNVSTLTACQTRLRFVLKDTNGANKEELNKLSGVLGLNETDDQFQVIIGPGVNKVLVEVEEALGTRSKDNNSNSNDNKQENKFSLKKSALFVLDYLSTSFSPILIAIIGAGVIKGLNILFTTTLGLYTADSGIGQIINLIGDIPFYYLPFFVAYGAAKRLNTSVPLALALAGAYMHPSIASSAANGNVWTIFNQSMPMLNYNGTVIPILLSVYLLSIVYKRVDKFVPSNVRILFVPVIVLLVIVPVQFFILGPVGYYFSGYVAVGLESLFSMNRWVGGFVYGAFRQVLVMTGMHVGMTPIILENIRVFGGDYLMPVHAMSSMAVAGTALGIYFKARKSEVKTSALAIFIPSFIGVTEPGIFGLAVKYIKPWISIAIGGGVSAAFVSGLGAKSIAVSLPGPLSFSIFADTLNVMIIGWIIAFVVSFVIAYVIGVDENR